jgi:hypothetical protein
MPKGVRGKRHPKSGQSARPKSGQPTRPRSRRKVRTAKHNKRRLPRGSAAVGSPFRDPWSDLFARIPLLHDAIVWFAPGPAASIFGVETPFRQWSPRQKAALKSVWTQIVNGTAPSLSFEPPVILSVNSGGDLFSTELTEAMAWRYFLYYTAQSLAVESQRLVSWSLREYSRVDLVFLLNSSSLFYYSSALGRYFVVSEHPSLPGHGASQPGDPVRTFEMVNARALVGADADTTVYRVLDWCRSNLEHFGGLSTPQNFQAYWGYPGWPPIDRVLRGTSHPQEGFAHWTAGCWGTTGFLRHILRTVNIPVELETVDGHALPHFRLPRRGGAPKDIYLSHGDDPYGLDWVCTPPVPISKLPIDETRFDTWFGSNAVLPPGGSNVGRATAELAVQFLSNFLLRLHCDDLVAGRNHAQSWVVDPQYGGLGLYYSVLELENMQLWTRMDAKIASLGGCLNVPPP